MPANLRFGTWSLIVVGASTLGIWHVSAETPSGAGKIVGSLICYDIPGGETLFALSLRGNDRAQRVVHDHVILVDTSASQAGAHREQGLKVLEGCLASLSSHDRVLLCAIDVQVKRLSETFAAPESEQSRAALAKLKERVPLGATSLQQALEAAIESFTGTNERSIIYIGDGMSTGKLVDLPAFRTLVGDLRAKHIPVSSFAVGPQTDLQMLGTLAEQTGGVVYVDAVENDARLPAEKLGQKLAAAADASVFYPKQISLAPAVDKLLPDVPPPIRSDRDTILLGKGHLADNVTVVATSDQTSLSWSIKPGAGQIGNTFLAGLWAMAEQSDGLLVAVAGNDLLNVARQEYEDQVGQLVVLGRQAVAARDLKQAEQIAQAVRQLDPANVQAATILNASQRVKAMLVALTKEQTGKGSDGATAREANSLLEQEQNLMRVRAERLSKEVAQTIAAATKAGATDPGAALSELKRTLTTIIASTNIDPDIREKLRAKVQVSIDRLLTVRDKIEMDKIASMEKTAAAKARELATDQLMQRDEQLEQLINKVSALLYEGYIGNANAFERAEEVARASFELAPYAGVTSSAIFTAEAAGQLDKAQRLRYRRYDMWLATLYQAEMAHIPFPDEPPIVYPAPEVWQSLTTRRQKWASVDLLKWNPNEEKIRKSLDKPTTVDFIDLPLEDCITFLHDYHGINIWLDRQTLVDEGVALDAPQTLKLAGVSLRSVLKLLLEPVQLTYVIENEVMKITTSTKAGEKLSTRVYPVGDLVIPIITPRAGRGGMGMMGGMGGGMMGGMGGMGGGMMGGMGGGMMGGMGGGMMNIPDR